MQDADNPRTRKEYGTQRLKDFRECEEVVFEEVSKSILL
jgi:hypothetical protein